jgi:hypothetical protein
MKNTKMVGVIFALLAGTIGWLTYLLNDQINGPASLSNSMARRAHQLADLFGSASIRFMQDHSGATPKQTHDLYPKYIKNLESVFPSSLKLRIGCPDADLDTNPELLDLYGVWTVLGDADHMVLVLNPRLFGRRHVAVYSWENGMDRTELVDLESLNSKLVGRNQLDSSLQNEK